MGYRAKSKSGKKLRAEPADEGGLFYFLVECRVRLQATRSLAVCKEVNSFFYRSLRGRRRKGREEGSSSAKRDRRERGTSNAAAYPPPADRASLLSTSPFYACYAGFFIGSKLHGLSSSTERWVREMWPTSWWISFCWFSFLWYKLNNQRQANVLFRGGECSLKKYGSRKILVTFQGSRNLVFWAVLGRCIVRW